MRSGRDSVLEVRDLAVEFRTRRGVVRALRHVDLSVARNKVVGIVGESGCGKSTLINTVLRLLAPNGAVSSGSVYFQGDDVLLMSDAELNRLRGQMVSVVFQDPMTALNPVISIGRQMTDMLLFVSHNLGLIAELCDEVVVMYAGEVVEQGDVRDLFHNARHPYTRMLLECDPARILDVRPELSTIPGTVPDLIDLPSGCILSPRCPHSFDDCEREAPETYKVHTQHSARCFLLRNG